MGKTLQIIARELVVASVHAHVTAGGYGGRLGRQHVVADLENYMANGTAKLSGPNFSQAVERSTIADRTTLLGHADGEPVLLTRRCDEVRVVAERQARRQRTMFLAAYRVVAGRAGARDETRTWSPRGKPSRGAAMDGACNRKTCTGAEP